MDTLDWSDRDEIAIELYDNFPDIDPQWISFLIYTQRFVI